MSFLFGRCACNRKNRGRLNNKTFTLISSNCNGGIICHDLGLPFNSPFVNLRIDPKDYIKMLKNLDYYLSRELKFIPDYDVDYPVAYLDDIKLHFMHYDSEKEASEKWYERLKRMDMDNLFVLFSDRDGCTYDDLLEFDRLLFNNKAVLCHKPYPNISSAYYIPGFENETQVGVLSEYRSEIFQIRYLDAFDYVKWFNEGY